jgi:CheY-like chemotaxis protein
MGTKEKALCLTISRYLIQTAQMFQINCTLLIDDDYINNFLHLKLIESLGISREIKVVQNGEEALDFIRLYCKLNKKCPELILLDINMPFMDGLSFLKAYESAHFSNKENAKIVMLTTSTDEQDILELKKYNIVSILDKPLTPEKILGVMQSAIA